MTPQQVAALIALRRGGDPGQRLFVLIGSVIANAAERADVSAQDRDGILSGARALLDYRDVLAGNGAT